MTSVAMGYGTALNEEQDGPLPPSKITASLGFGGKKTLGEKVASIGMLRRPGKKYPMVLHLEAQQRNILSYKHLQGLKAAQGGLSFSQPHQFL